MNRRVSVWKYVRIGKKWRYCKPAVGKNGKIKPEWVPFAFAVRYVDSKSAVATQVRCNDQLQQLFVSEGDGERGRNRTFNLTVELPIT